MEPEKKTPSEKSETSQSNRDSHHEPSSELSSKNVDALSTPLDLPSDNLLKPHFFWDTQPVPKVTDTLPDTLVGPIDSFNNVQNIRPTPYTLPEPFHWVTCNLEDDQELAEIYTLLNQNYVEDDDHMFRFDYSQEFLRWALCPPGYVKDWHIGVKTDKGKLVAFITGIPCQLVVFDKQISMVEINFLCVHVKLRSKRLAPVLIKEITRRINLHDVWQAVYTAGILLTKPVAQCTYFHRSLNIKKLVEVGFISLKKRLTMSMAQKLYKLPETPKIDGLREMKIDDIPTILELITEESKNNYKLYPVFSLKELEHLLLPRENVVVSYVREVNGKVTDFFSFYILNSSVLRHEKHEVVKAAYSFYMAATTVSRVDLMFDALIIAKNADMDVFNCLDQSQNRESINSLKFGQGDGSLKYYLYNYLCPGLKSEDVGLIML